MLRMDPSIPHERLHGVDCQNCTLAFKESLKQELLPYSLTPWSKVLLEQLPASQLVKKFPAFYGTRNFITAFTSAHQLSLS